MKQRSLLIAGGISAVLALIWLATRIEFVPDTERIGYSGEALVNPYLAALRFMRMGLTASEVKAAPELERLPPRAVLLLPNRRQALTPVHRAQILKWVEGGGHLILEVEDVPLSDPYADALGIRRVRAREDPGKRGPVSLPQAAAPMQLGGAGLGTGVQLVAPAAGVRTSVETSWGLQLVQIERGRGLITVAADFAFAENRLIGVADNAEFLWQIVRSLPENREFILFHRIERLSLWQWLTDHTPAVLVSFAALLLLWLWRIGPRFGPVAADEPPARRRLLDHLRASGRFHWMNRGRDRLIEAAREACLARLARAHPGFAALPPGERAAQLAKYAGISEAEAARLLAPSGARRGAEFIALMRALQQVHARLDRGA